MADREQRERESQQEPDDKFHQQRDEEQATRERVAEDIENAPLTDREDKRA
jgi:hypothetical protein